MRRLQPFPAREWHERIAQTIARLRIAVVHGGDRAEAGAVLHAGRLTRSWKSYAAVAEDLAGALRRIGVRAALTLPEDMRLPERLRREHIDLVWLNTGGLQGLSPVCHAPALLEMLGMPYVGHNPLNAALLDNKHAFKRELVALGYPTAEFMVWNPDRGRFLPAMNSRFRATFRDYHGPFVVKPVTGRASLNIHTAETTEDLGATVDQVAASCRNLVLIERFLPGREFCIAVMGPVVAREGELFWSRTPFVLSPTERLLDPGEAIFASMDHRAITPDRVRLLDAALPQDALLRRRLCRLARHVYLDFNLETIVRIDLRADEQGKLHILEANPKPDLKVPDGNSTNLVALGLDEQGMSYDDLILSILASRLHELLAMRPDAAGRLPALADAGSGAN
ncbi:MAG: D-alanyl-alanine synthetase [Alphaproteobacteria bacterium]|nr:D-alanyl-alanine synthetase [Alphaproteobacteria bacterium]